MSKLNRQLKETDKAYLAGLFDGEGCINAAISTRRYKPKKQQRICFHAWGKLNFSITNKDHNLLKKVKEIAYGFGEVYPKSPVYGAVYTWRVTDPVLLPMLFDALIPYLKLKKKALLLAMKAAQFLIERKNRQRWKKRDLTIFNEKFVLPLQKPLPSGKRGRPPKYTFQEILSNLC